MFVCACACVRATAVAGELFIVTVCVLPLILPPFSFLESISFSLFVYAYLCTVIALSSFILPDHTSFPTPLYTKCVWRG